MRAKGGGAGLSRQVDISGSFARTPQHILSSWTSGVGAIVSTQADGQASVPTALDCAGPLARQLSASELDLVLSGTEWTGRCLPVAASSESVSIQVLFFLF